MEFYSELNRVGEMPVPPYIIKARSLDGQKTNSKKQINDDERDYQNVYAKTEGSVAAPTAGLHFTDELLTKLREKGVQLEYVTLHVGLGTFQPVTAENVEDFHIHSEYYEISKETVKRLNSAKREGRRIIAVGTTAVRVLESATTEVDSYYNSVDSGKSQKNIDCTSNEKYQLKPSSGETNIFIYPGYDFKFVGGMITNFHLPKSSLLLLVSAFAGQEKILKSYDYAVINKYRFYSYGDGMVII